ncbi:MAG: APC family permease [Pseudomonadales bacterium]
MPTDPRSPQRLRRVLNLPLLTLYGLGTTIGAGIYALAGEIAGIAGYGAPLSFLLAALVAGFTACSFAELSARFPQAAGAALYVQQGFGRRDLARIVGLLVTAAGVVSAAALVNAFAGYLASYLPAPRFAVIGVTALGLAGIAAWGIAQSVAVAALITLVEVGGLLVIVGLGVGELASLPSRWREFLPGADSHIDAAALLLGVTLAFYAFIGFEDMVDVAEEIKDVRRTLPRAILATLAITTVLYLLLMVTALLAMPPAALAATTAPLAAVYEVHTGRPGVLIGVVAMIAIINGALVQMVMASRVLYGLAQRGQMPGWLGRVHPTTRTPLLATAAVGTVVLVLAAYGHLAGLARTTSLLVLVVFTLANLALWRLKSHSRPPDGAFECPRALPLIGCALCVALVLHELVSLIV